MSSVSLHVAANTRREPSFQNSRKPVSNARLVVGWPFAITDLSPGTAASRPLFRTTRCRPVVSNFTGSIFGAHRVEVGTNHGR